MFISNVCAPHALLRMAQVHPMRAIDPSSGGRFDLTSNMGAQNIQIGRETSVGRLDGCCPDGVLQHND